MYLLKIKGVVAKNKKVEFNQSLNFLFEQFPPKWHRSHIANDIIQEDVYYFESIWESKEDLDDFMKNEKYKALIGAFKVLGIKNEVIMGELNDTDAKYNGNIG
jgi:hypothetical protein